jgi:signal transduction histidine kinase
MPLREDRAPVWAIWLLIAFGAVQPLAWGFGVGLPRHPVAFVPLLVVWITLLALAAIATRRITALSRRLSQKEQDHTASLTEVDQLQTQNAMLDIIARSVDVPLAFQALAARVARLAPCDRVGLALLSEDGREFQTYTARVQQEERRTRPRPEIVFRSNGPSSAASSVRASRDHRRHQSPHPTTSMRTPPRRFSRCSLPLVRRTRVGTLNVVSRRPDAVSQPHVDALHPIAEILAVAWVAQQLHMTLGKHRTMEVMSELTLSVAAEINSALQTIIGHCDLIGRGQTDVALQRDLQTIMGQAQRIDGLLDKMRTAAHERLREMAHVMSEEGIPTRPEVWWEFEV